MKMLITVFGLLLSLLTAPHAFATASSVTQTIYTKQLENGRPVKVYHLFVTASSVDGSVADVTLPKIHGFLMKAITNPGAVAPTANYDIQLMDTDDATSDASNAVLMNRHTSNTETIWPVGALGAAPLWFQPSDYTLHITNNSVNSATVDIWLYFSDDKGTRL